MHPPEGALMNKTPDEAWELIESVADNNQYFKTRAMTTARGVYEITPSESNVLVKSLTDIASVLKELKEGQKAGPKILIQPSHNSQQLQILRKSLSDECPQLQEDNVVVSSHNFYDGNTISPPNRSYQPQSQGWRDNQQSCWNYNQPTQYRQPYTTNQPQNPQTQRYQPSHNRQLYHSNNPFPSSYEDILRAFQQENKEMREAQKKTEAQITNLTELLTKFTNQETTNPSTSSPPRNPSPLRSQPLSNPKGGINMVQKRDEEADKKKARTEWLLELMAEIDKLGGSNDEYWIWDNSDEEDEEGSDEEGEVEEDAEEKDEKEEVNGSNEKEKEAKEECGTLCIATVFKESKVDKPVILVKCEDPGPCLVTCEVRGVNIMDCLCDPGAYESVMPYELYALLDLGPLKKTKDVFQQLI
ncbi:hypothetical protein PIB30_053062 [Stylosanthes scabra]|uniref:Uncharacterized protein n=1 Tax=Stylosanthes scabra TaxID=79078 RepID=A0ABU6WGH8_9FABA|nr:hypothetical protein [Stylosanthes scabra]